MALKLHHHHHHHPSRVRPVLVSSDSLFKGLPGHLHPTGLHFSIIFGILLVILITSLNERSITFIQKFVKIGHPVQKNLSLSQKKCTSTLTFIPSHSIIKREQNKKRGRGSHWCTLTVNRKSCISHLGTCPRVLRILFWQYYQLQNLFIQFHNSITPPAVTTVRGHLQHWCISKMSTGQNMSDRLLGTWQHVTLIFNETRLSQVLHYQLYANADKTQGADRYCLLLK